MKFSKLLCAGLLMAGTTLASAAPIFQAGDSVVLTTGSSDFDMSGAGSANVDHGVGIFEFTVCVFALGGSCGTGNYLEFQVDLHDDKVDVNFIGGTGTGSAGAFMFELSDLLFDPPATISDVTPATEGLDEGMIAVNWTVDSIQFIASNDSGQIAATGTLPFTVTADPVQVPEPGTLLLLGMSLAGLGYARRRPAC